MRGKHRTLHLVLNGGQYLPSRNVSLFIRGRRSSSRGIDGKSGTGLFRDPVKRLILVQLFKLFRHRPGKALRAAGG